jgi:uncharacterized membrane protein YedE/YeeE
MNYWPWWLGGAALAAAMVLHWVLVRRMMGVSGRFTSLVDRARSGEGPADLTGLLTPADGQPPSAHLVFLIGLVLGGLLSAAFAGHVGLVAGITSVSFTRLTHGSFATGAVLLFTGGMLVGFGTRMAGGCTSGHGMCGVSRFQKGSLLATAAFFGSGVAVSLLLQRAL